MTPHVAPTDEFIELMSDLAEDRMSPAQIERLDELLRTDPANCRNYVDFMAIVTRLAWIGDDEPDAAAHSTAGQLPETLARWTSDRGDASVSPSLPPRLESAPSSAVSAPFPTLSPPAIDGSAGYFTSGWPAAYLVATVIFGIGLAIGAIVHVSAPTAFDRQPTPLPSPVVSVRSDVVGRITGTVDCEWEGSGLRGQGSEAANQKSEIISDKSVMHLGDRLALRSGLLELTYDTGATVILQGPVTYEVESPSGGYLSLGKLTARLEKKSEVRGQRSEPANHRSEIIDQKSFVIRTPTTTITDLGTEFGVEVLPGKETRVCVFQGKVSLRAGAAGVQKELVLGSGQSSQVDARGTLQQDPDAKTTNLAGALVRNMPHKGFPTFVSLTDLVAGGNGFGDRSFWGINPLDASAMAQISSDEIQIYSSNRTYQRYSGRPQIDGVFIPDGGTGPVQLNSAGHTFALPKTSAKTCEWAIWVYKGKPWAEPSRVKPSGRPDAASSSTLLLHPNAGITFDLAAIRDSARGCNASRFQSTVHNCQWKLNAPKVLFADVWVFVDGQLRFSRTKFRKADGPMDIDVPLKPNDRFLTLVSTDGGDDYDYDNPCFLNPRISLEAAQ